MPKFHLLNRWSLGMENQFHPTPYITLHDKNIFTETVLVLQETYSYINCTYPVKCELKLHIHAKTSSAEPLKFRNGKPISSHTLHYIARQKYFHWDGLGFTRNIFKYDQLGLYIHVVLLVAAVTVVVAVALLNHSSSSYNQANTTMSSTTAI